MAEASLEFRPCRKFPEYEVSRNGIVRHRQRLNEIAARVEPGDTQRRRKLHLARGFTMFWAFADELVNDAWPETRQEAA